MLTDNLLMDYDLDNNENDLGNNENVIIKNDSSDDADDDISDDIDSDYKNVLCHADVAFQMKRLVIQGRCSLSDNCMICLENMHRSKCVYLPCKHAFHSKCFTQLVERRIDTCPLCRAGFKDYLSVLRLPRGADDEQIEMIFYIENAFVDTLLDWLRQNYEIVEE